MAPGAAMLSKRAAILTPSPIKSPSLSRASQWIKRRNAAAWEHNMNILWSEVKGIGISPVGGG
jgi:hypothetical protein